MSDYKISNSDLRRGTQQSQIETYPAFGIVFKGTYNGQDVAIKVLKLQQESEYFRLDSWRDEIASLKTLSHENVARFLGTSEDSSWATVQEWVDGQDLKQALRNYPDGAPTAFAGRVGKQIAEGLEYLHSKDVLHLSLTPGNVIVGNGDRIKLKDYGLRAHKLASHQKYTTHGNPRYAAIELIMREHDKIGTHSDVWSWASVICLCVTGQEPFKGYLPPQVARKVWEANQRPDVEDVADAGLKSLLGRCWSTSGSSRPSVRDLISNSRNFESSSAPGSTGSNASTLFKAQPSSSSSGGSRAAPAASGGDADLDDMLADLDDFEIN